MTAPEETAAGHVPVGTRLQSWLHKAIWAGVLAGVLVVTYFLAAAFLPRWWAQRVGQLSASSMQQGILWGLLFGALCTFIPLLLFAFAWRLRNHRWLLAGLPILGLLAAVPNLLTLAVVVGGNNSAHAGERIMDVDAPGFRGATLAGVIAGAVAFLLVSVMTFMYRRRGRQMKSLQAQQAAAG